MQIRIASNDGVPIYDQIVNPVKQLVSAGRLAPGNEISAIRVLADQGVVNPNQVARAYLECNRRGVVTKRHGSRTYVSEARSPMSRRATHRFETAPARQQVIPGALSVSGAGKEWVVVCHGTQVEFPTIAASRGARMVEEHAPSLDEIFVTQARASAPEASPAASAS